MKKFLFYAYSLTLSCLLGVFLFMSVPCFASDISIAGFAFSGDFKTAAERFPYTFKLHKRIQSEHAAKKTFSFLVNERAKALKNPDINFRSDGSLINLKKSDRALMTALC